jgi:hypothetical protein
MARTIRTFAIALLVLALGAVVGAGPVAAKKKKVRGSVKMTYEYNPAGPDRFFGTVNSPNSRCIRGATVALGFKPAFEGGGGSDYPRTTVARTKSDTAGNWSISYEVTPNGISDFSSYSAAAPVRTLKTKKKGLKLVCKFATSEVITLFPG